MKVSLSAWVVALASIAAADAATKAKCTPGQLEELVGMLATTSKDHVRDCQAASGGFSIFPPAAKSPTDDQIKSMCASTACNDLLGEVLGSGLANCVLEWNGKSINPHQMGSSLQTICGMINRVGSGSGSSSDSVNSAGSGSGSSSDTGNRVGSGSGSDVESVSVGSVASESELVRRRSSGKSNSPAAVEVGVIETYRPGRKHSEHYTPSRSCGNYAHGGAAPEVSSYPTPKVTDKSEWPYTKHPTPAPTYVKYETFKPVDPSYPKHSTPAPTHVKNETHRPDDEPRTKSPTPTVTTSPDEQYFTPAATYGPHVPPKPQWAHGVTHTPGNNWYQREDRHLGEVATDKYATIKRGHLKPSDGKEDKDKSPGQLKPSDSKEDKDDAPGQAKPSGVEEGTKAEHGNVKPDGEAKDGGPEQHKAK